MSDVIAINRVRRMAVTDDDVLLHFAAMLDRDGDETDDEAEAVVAIAQHPDGTWWTIDLSAFGSDNGVH